MSTLYSALHFVWWNMQDLAHFDITRTGNVRWPKSRGEYDEKRRRIETVLQLVSADKRPQLLAFAEITEQAAKDLRDKLFPSYKVYSLASDKTRSHIALIYDPNAQLGGEELLTVSNVPDTTRSMAILDYRTANDVIRFYVCHWTAPFNENSEKSRQLSALQLSSAIHRFLRPDEATEETRHVVILGDLNEEPYSELLEKWLYAYRDRARSRFPAHYTDKEIERAYLYNCAWKLLGERTSHPPPPGERTAAGSYYWRDHRTWHTVDQVLVSGSLLSREVPYLDEASVEIVSSLEPETNGLVLGLVLWNTESISCG